MTVALLWDVDGTLLTTKRAGILSFEDVLERMTGTRLDLAKVPTAGLPDYAIVERILRSVGHDAGEPTVQEFLRLHGEQLADYLGRRDGHVMPGVREVLEDLRGRDDVRSLLLTGNTETGAYVKLAHYGLDGFFPEGGAFCVGPGERVDIARRALALADDAEHVYVIGDTPADVVCGREIGVRTIAVATGAFSLEELAATGPWRVLEQLPEPDAFRQLVGIA